MPINGVRRPLVTNEPVEYDKRPLKAQSQVFMKTTHHLEESTEYFEINKKKPQVNNMWLVGVGNTRVLTDDAPKLPMEGR